MKKLIFLLIAGQYSLSAIAQDKPIKSYTTDKDLSRVVLDLNMMGGIYDQKMDIANTASNYLDGINVVPGKTGFKKGSASGGNIQLGLFMGKNKHWGLGTGLLYLRETGTVTLNDFHAEYRSVDNNGFTFRQVVSANDINEKIKIDNFNIPLVLKYKNRFSKHWGFTADAGALFNVKMKNSYTTNASFDYEAIYKFVTNEGKTTPIYETAIIPANEDFLITRDHYTKNNPNGNVNDYFNDKRDAGYNVGLDVNPQQQKGSVNYATGSIGFLFQPSVNYFFSDKVALNVGGYYLYQPFKNDGANNNYTMTGNPGTYNSVLNSSTKIQTQSYGGNVGLRFFLGKKSPEMNITSTDRFNPTACGLCDGSFALHGLKAGENSTVSNRKNGAAVSNAYTSTVTNEAVIAVQNHC